MRLGTEYRIGDKQKMVPSSQAYLSLDADPFSQFGLQLQIVNVVVANPTNLFPIPGHHGFVLVDQAGDIPIAGKQPIAPAHQGGT